TRGGLSQRARPAGVHGPAGRIRTVRFETRDVFDTRSRAAACVLALGGLLLAPPSAHAANLIADADFETTGSSSTVFSDNLPDLSALQVTSGNVVLAGGTATTPASDRRPTWRSSATRRTTRM